MLNWIKVWLAPPPPVVVGAPAVARLVAPAVVQVVAIAAIAAIATIATIAIITVEGDIETNLVIY